MIDAEAHDDVQAVDAVSAVVERAGLIIVVVSDAIEVADQVARINGPSRHPLDLDPDTRTHGNRISR